MVGLPQQRRRGRLDVVRDVRRDRQGEGDRDAPALGGQEGRASRRRCARLNLEVRPFLDELIVEKATDFIKRAGQERTSRSSPTSALSHMHPPEGSHPDFDQTDPERLGEYADLIAEMDHRVGQIVDCVEEAGIADNTVIVFSSDNAAGDDPGVRMGGSNGPWRGDFITPPSEGSMRTAGDGPLAGRRCRPGWSPRRCSRPTTGTRPSRRWPAPRTRCPPTARWTASTPRSSCSAESENTGRDSILFFGPDGSMMSVKWHNIKVWLRYSEGFDKPIVKPQFPMIFDLGSDPNERYNLFNGKMDMGWMIGVVLPAASRVREELRRVPEHQAG